MPDAANAAKGNALVVCHDPETASGLVKVLSNEGYQASFEKNPSEALEKIVKSQIELLLLDLSMPGGGLELLKEAKRKSPYLEALALSDGPQLESAVEAVRAGAFDYLSKPVSAATLLEKAQAALDLRRERMETDLSETVQLNLENSPLAKYVIVKELSKRPLCEISALESDSKSFLLLSYPSLPEASSQPDVLSALFLRIAQRVQLLDHPNIVKLVEHGFQDGGVRPYVVVERAGGRLLRTALEAKLKPGAKLAMARQASCALAKLHEASIFLGAFSLDSIIAEESGTSLKLLDFGFDCLFDLSMRKLGKRCAMDRSLMAPELLADPQARPDVKSDVYSLAALICAIFSNGDSLLREENGGKVRKPEEFPCPNEKMAFALELLLGSMLQATPAARPASDEALSALNVLCTMPDMLDTVIETYNAAAAKTAWL